MAVGIPAAKTTKGAPTSSKVSARAFFVSSFILEQVLFTTGCLLAKYSSIPVSVISLILDKKYIQNFSCLFDRFVLRNLTSPQ